MPILINPYIFTIATVGNTDYFYAGSTLWMAGSQGVMAGWTDGESPLMTSLVSSWKMEEASGTRNDSHGTNHLTPDAFFPGNQVGVVGNATADANAGHPNNLSIASNSSLEMGDIDFTIAGWFKLNNFAGTPTFFSKASSGLTNLEYALIARSTTGGWAFIVKDTADTTMGTVDGPDIADTDFHFVVCWHDAAANTINLQVDNGEVSSLEWSGGVRASSNGFAFFGSADGSAGCYGAADEVNIWKRVLTTQEKDALYNGGIGLTYPF